MTLWIEGVVENDFTPHLEIRTEHGLVGTMTMAEARNVAMDILQACARAETDATIHQLMTGLPSAAMMNRLRQLRDRLDLEPVERKRA